MRAPVNHFSPLRCQSRLRNPLASPFPSTLPAWLCCGERLRASSPFPSRPVSPHGAQRSASGRLCLLFTSDGAACAPVLTCRLPRCFFKYDPFANDWSVVKLIITPIYSVYLMFPTALFLNGIEANRKTNFPVPVDAGHWCKHILAPLLRVNW